MRLRQPLRVSQYPIGDELWRTQLSREHPDALDIAQGRLAIAPADILHQRLEVPAIARGPGSKAAAQRMAAVHPWQPCRLQSGAQERNDTVRVQPPSPRCPQRSILRNTAPLAIPATLMQPRYRSFIRGPQYLIAAARGENAIAPCSVNNSPLTERETQILQRISMGGEQQRGSTPTRYQPEHSAYPRREWVPQTAMHNTCCRDTESANPGTHIDRPKPAGLIRKTSANVYSYHSTNEGLSSPRQRLKPSPISSWGESNTLTKQTVKRSDIAIANIVNDFFDAQVTRLQQHPCRTDAQVLQVGQRCLL